MIQPELTPDEPARLEALHRTNLVDSGLEERFDRITRLVKHTLGCRMAVVSLVDADRQFFKSVDGLDSCGTARDISFCGHAIHEGDFLLIRDARLDPRFADNPLVVGPPHIVSYAGAVLRSPEGFRLGSLCAIDIKPRSYTPAELRALRDLASIVEREMALSGGGVGGAVHDERGVLSSEARQTDVDPVSRVWDRGAILGVAAREVELARERGRGVGLVVVTIDGLVDPKSGSGCDESVRLAARRILGSVRSTDSVGRLGECEFLCVMTPCASHRSVAPVVARICERIERELMITGAGDDASGVGIGVVVMDPGDTVSTVDSLIERARDELRGGVDGREIDAA